MTVPYWHYNANRTLHAIPVFTHNDFVRTRPAGEFGQVKHHHDGSIRDVFGCYMVQIDDSVAWYHEADLEFNDHADVPPVPEIQTLGTRPGPHTPKQAAIRGAANAASNHGREQGLPVPPVHSDVEAIPNPVGEVWGMDLPDLRRSGPTGQHRRALHDSFLHGRGHHESVVASLSVPRGSPIHAAVQGPGVLCQEVQGCSADQTTSDGVAVPPTRMVEKQGREIDPASAIQDPAAHSARHMGADVDMDSGASVDQYLRRHGETRQVSVAGDL